MLKGLHTMDYGLWLLTDSAGQITLTGWSESTADTDAHTDAKTDHWPTYILCRTRAQLQDRLHDLGLDLAPGAAIADLDKDWDVYLRHPDITALRTQLERDKNASAA